MLLVMTWPRFSCFLFTLPTKYIKTKDYKGTCQQSCPDGGVVRGLWVIAIRNITFFSGVKFPGPLLAGNLVINID